MMTVADSRSNSISHAGCEFFFLVDEIESCMKLILNKDPRSPWQRRGARRQQLSGISRKKPRGRQTARQKGGMMQRVHVSQQPPSSYSMHAARNSMNTHCCKRGMHAAIPTTLYYRGSMIGTSAIINHSGASIMKTGTLD
mgnify:CR=1 FL=1